MKKIISYAIFASIMMLHTSVANAQEWKDHWTDYHWTNGGEMLSSVRLNDSQILLVGNGYFDAGYGYLFEIKNLSGTNYDMKGIPETAVTSRPQSLDLLSARMLDDKNCIGDDGEVWARREVSGHDLLISYRDDNTIGSVYVPTGRQMNEVVDDDLQSIIVGTYVSTKGKSFRFNADGTCVFDGQANTYYLSDEGEGNTPSLHITLNRRIWELEPTPDGMRIYRVHHSEDDGSPVRDGLYATLKASKSVPRWSFLSDRICTSFALISLSKDVLRLMRNELYARHGYRFSDKKLQAYFDACKWYKPVSDNKSVKLSELETLNVAIIKQFER